MQRAASLSTTLNSVTIYLCSKADTRVGVRCLFSVVIEITIHV